MGTDTATNKTSTKWYRSMVDTAKRWRDIMTTRYSKTRKTTTDFFTKLGSNFHSAYKTLTGGLGRGWGKLAKGWSTVKTKFSGWMSLGRKVRTAESTIIHEAKTATRATRSPTAPTDKTGDGAARVKAGEAPTAPTAPFEAKKEATAPSVPGRSRGEADAARTGASKTGVTKTDAADTDAKTDKVEEKAD